MHLQIDGCITFSNVYLKYPTLCQGKAGAGQGGREPPCPRPWGGALDEVEWHPNPACEFKKVNLELRKGCATGPRSDSSSSSWRAPQHCCLSPFPWQVSGNLRWQQEDNSHLTDLWKFLNLGGQFLLKTITKDHVPMLWHISKCS